MNKDATVLQTFLDSVASNPGGLAIHVTTDDGIGTAITNAELFEMACKAYGWYLQKGVTQGDRIILALPASPQFFAAYVGAWFGGIIPVVTTSSGIEKSGAVLRVTIADELMNASPASPINIHDDDVSHLQCTSGSTSSPRLVIIRHKNIRANVWGIGTAIKHQPNDKLVSWLPLSHDMGLIGLSYALGWQCPFICTTTTRFIRNPYTWLQMISGHKGTLSPAPNAAFLACARLAKLRPPKGIDLSSWRVALCGSEPVQESTVLQFEEAFRPFGYHAETMLPVYGLAESTLAVTIPEPGILPHAETVERNVRVVALGTALPGHSFRIVNETGATLPEGEVGEIELSGPSLSDGYWLDEIATAELKTADGFTKTGDLGFQLQGQLYITGRKKDIIIIGGRNFSPFLIETLAMRCLEPWLVKAIVAIGVPDKKIGTEMLHLLIDARVDEASKLFIEGSIRQCLLEDCAISGITIHWVSKDAIPYTTSGKVQRYLCRQIIQRQTI